MHKLIKPFMSNKATGHDDDTISNSEAIEMRCAMFPRSFFFPRPINPDLFLMQQAQEWKPKPSQNVNLVTTSIEPSGMDT